MSRFAVFAIVASACLSGLHGQEGNSEKKTSAAPLSPPGSVKGAAEAAAQSSATEKIQKPPKKIVIGGASVDFFGRLINLPNRDPQEKFEDGGC